MVRGKSSLTAMSVYTNKYDDLQGFGPGGHNERSCSICEEELRYPFLGWDAAGGGIFLCGDCCIRWRDGLIADLIHAAAAAELGRLYQSNQTKQCTLIRKDYATLRREHERLEQELKKYGPRVVKIKENGGLTVGNDSM